jgi:hypothetical protein
MRRLKRFDARATRIRPRARRAAAVVSAPSVGRESGPLKPMGEPPVPAELLLSDDVSAGELATANEEVPPPSEGVDASAGCAAGASAATPLPVSTELPELPETAAGLEEALAAVAPLPAEDEPRGAVFTAVGVELTAPLLPVGPDWPEVATGLLSATE